MRDGSGRSEVRGEAALYSHLSQAGVSRWQNHLTQLFKVESTIRSAIELADNIINISHSRTQIMLAHEILKFATGNGPVVVPVNVCKQLVWFEIRISR